MIGESVRCRAFVGRRRELAALDERRKALAKSEGSFVLVSGEAGIGKTRLLNEFLSIAQDHRARNVVSAECLQRTQHPLGPVRAFVRALSPSLKMSELPLVVVRALVQLIPGDLPREFVSSHAEFELEKEQLFSGLLAMFASVCAKRATILTVEDLQWSDESTVEFLGYLAGRMDAMRLLIVATTRTDDLERNERLLASMAQLFRARSLHRVMLEPLPPAEIHAVVEGTVEGRDAIPDTVARSIEQRSEGNPFFAEELVKGYLEQHESGRKASQLPLSIRSSIMERLVALDADQRMILANAAIVGQRFDPSVLAAIMGRTVDAIEPALHRARELNLLADGDPGRHSCRFRHALTRQTILESVPPFYGRRIHLKILATLEARPDSERFIEELADHAAEAGDADKTLLYNERAGEAAFGLRALPEALTYFRRALDAATSPDDRARLLDRVGAVERVQGHSEAARDSLEASLAIRLELGEVDKAAFLAASVLGQRYNLGDPNALGAAEMFLAEHGSAITAVARDHLLVVCARVACALGNIPAAERFLDAVSDPATLATGIRQNYLIVKLMLHAYVGDRDAWRQSAGEVERRLPQLRPEAVVSTEAALGMTGIFLGANEEVERALDRADRIEREWGFRGQRLYAAATRASYLFQRGRLADAHARVEEVAAHQDFHPARRVAALVAAHLAVALSDNTIWTRFDPEVLREARCQHDDPDCAYILGAHAELSVRNGARDEAEADLRAAIGSLKYAAPEAMYVVINAARFLPLDELSRVRELVDAAAARGDATQAIQAVVVAVIASREGRQAEAVASAATAATLFESLGWPLLEAFALEIAGKSTRARQLYDTCGAVGEVRRLAGSADRKTAVALSNRETEVAELVANGLRNAEIARRLSIGKKTVEKHLSSVFDKLGLRSRAQIGAYVAAMKARTPQ